MLSMSIIVYLIGSLRLSSVAVVGGKAGRASADGLLPELPERDKTGDKVQLQ